MAIATAAGRVPNPKIIITASKPSTIVAVASDVGPLMPRMEG